jgi:hypothetical protein
MINLPAGGAGVKAAAAGRVPLATLMDGLDGIYDSVWRRPLYRVQTSKEMPELSALLHSETLQMRLALLPPP